MLNATFSIDLPKAFINLGASITAALIIHTKGYIVSLLTIDEILQKNSYYGTLVECRTGALDSETLIFGTDTPRGTERDHRLWGGGGS